MPRVVTAAPILVAVPPIADGVPPGFALPAIHGGLHPAGFPPLIILELAPPAEEGVGRPPVDHVSVTTVDQLGVVSRWFHGPAGFEELHGVFVTPSSIVRLTRRGPSNATGWFAEVQLFVCSDPLFGQLLAQLLSPTGSGVFARLLERFIFVLHMGFLASVMWFTVTQ